MEASFVFPSPCAELGCTLKWWPDLNNLGMWYQHGDNPEHRKFLSERELIAYPDGGGPLPKWLVDIHEHERRTDE